MVNCANQVEYAGEWDVGTVLAYEHTCSEWEAAAASFQRSSLLSEASI